MTPNRDVLAAPADYEAPKLTVLGSVADLTHGQATPGTEAFDDGSQE